MKKIRKLFLQCVSSIVTLLPWAFPLRLKKWLFIRMQLFLYLAGTACYGAEVSVHFSPHGGCSAAIIEQVGRATNQILVQAYNFTSPSIGDSLAAAVKRGVKVVEIQDNVAAHQGSFQGPKLAAAGGAVFIDKKHRIAHNKIAIIDNGVLITGSFNFSDNAENSNAENLLVITGDRKLVESYMQNWSNHLAHSTRYVAPIASPKLKSCMKHLILFAALCLTGCQTQYEHDRRAFLHYAGKHDALYRFYFDRALEEQRERNTRQIYGPNH